MKSTSKRMWMRAGFAVFALSASTLMVSCGKKEEPKEVAKEAPMLKRQSPNRSKSALFMSDLSVMQAGPLRTTWHVKRSKKNLAKKSKPVL